MLKGHDPGDQKSLEIFRQYVLRIYFVMHALIEKVLLEGVYLLQCFFLVDERRMDLKYHYKVGHDRPDQCC